MTKQITIKEALELVSFDYSHDCGWLVRDIYGDVKGIVNGDVAGNVGGNIYGHVKGIVNGDVVGNVNGTVYGDVRGNVRGKINGRKWEFVETPKDKLQRLIEESGNQELIDTFNQQEDNQ
jgi:hypothetical protein